MTTERITIPIIPVSDIILFPKMVHSFFIEDNDTYRDLLKLLKKKPEKDRVAGLIKSDLDFEEDKCKIGTYVKIIESKKEKKSGIKLTVQGLSRFKLKKYLSDPYPTGEIVFVTEKGLDKAKIEALVPTVIRLYKRLIDFDPTIRKETSNLLASIKNASQLCDMVVSSLSITNEEKQEFLEIIDVEKRLKKLVHLISYKIEQFKITSNIVKKARESMDNNQREYYLRKQLEEIKKQLGEDEDDPNDEVEEYAEKIAAKDLPEQANKEALRELKRLKRAHSSSAERSVITTYLDWILDLPWNDFSEENLNVKEAQEILDADHYGLEEPKKRIIQYLSVKKLKDDPRSPILCFVGPPGTGKTSIGKSIARALGREFIRISLGGVRDEAEIRGHRRTYIGALPGRIIQGLKRAGTNNPIFMLDEVDKLGNDFRGDPSSALLEALDPEQNHEFSDHYLSVDYDLSNVMFITTANRLNPIPPALKDRMEVIKFSGYTTYEKLQIAKQFLVKKQRDEHGLECKQIKFTDKAIDKIINDYTNEAGVRNLEREIATVSRGVASDIIVEETDSVSITLKNIHKYLGREKFPPSNKIREMLPGMAPVLYVGGAGGFVNYIESTILKEYEGDFEDNLVLTGQLGDVMQESAIIALSYLCSISDDINISENIYNNLIHIHVPDGSTPKDGSSAGVSLFITLVSLFTGKSVRNDIAMTGEITLKGDVLPIGGVKEKTLAAHRAGMKTVILPEWNKRDLDDIPDEIKEDVEFKFVKNLKDVIKIVFD